ncbi:MAG: hypothetical protein AABZ36_01565 [Nitrospirota bacterium]
MKENGKNIIFVLFILAISILAIVYFSMPERVSFIKNEIRWWSGFPEVIKSLL